MAAIDRATRAVDSKHALVENVKPRDSPLTFANVKLLQRPLSALARHRIHQLSDIREVSGSSKDGALRKKPSTQLDGAGTDGGAVTEQQNVTVQDRAAHDMTTAEHLGPRGGLGHRAPSAMSLPFTEVPERRSSASVLGANATSRQSSIQDFPSWRLPPASAAGQMVPPRGRADSPVRRALQGDAISADGLVRANSKTFIRTVPPLDVLDTGNSRHGRIDMSVRLGAPLFVGGGTIEGFVDLAVDGGTSQKTKTKPIFVSKMSIDVVGVEEVNDGRRWIFLSLATDVFDEDHPPPMSLVTSQVPVSHSELFWSLKPATVSLPFCINLPLNIGPPPYVCKQAGIRYFLCPTIAIKTGGKQSVVRQLCNIQMLTVHDPEKALASLPNPLLASDTISIPSGTQVQRVKLTAGLHRQIWVNGANIFVDIHVANHSSKTIKKIEIQLDKTTLWYSHPAAGTGGKAANHLRLPKRTDGELVSTSVIKKSKEWKGVLPDCSEVRTCDISVPRGLATISTGRYFEVRYFLNIIVTISTFKTITVQLPVTIIHINSLDILPNSVAQVAAAIEAKRAKTVPVGDDEPLHPPFHQGQAFAAPRRQSLDRMRDSTGGLSAEDLLALTRDLDDSPRRYAQGLKPLPILDKLGGGEGRGRPNGTASSHHHHIRHPSCYHCHVANDRQAGRKQSISSLAGPKLPRLQLSTSGLGFSDSEFEVPADSPPRKVMLSESERKMILQQREDKLQRSTSENNRRKQNIRRSSTEQGFATESQVVHRGWKNVAAPNDTTAPRQDRTDRKVGLQRGHSAREDHGKKRRSAPTRMRSKTNPERLGPVTHRRTQKGVERQHHAGIRPGFDRASRMPLEDIGKNARFPRSIRSMSDSRDG